MVGLLSPATSWKSQMSASPSGCVWAKCLLTRHPPQWKVSWRMWDTSSASWLRTRWASARPWRMSCPSRPRVLMVSSPLLLSFFLLRFRNFTGLLYIYKFYNSCLFTYPLTLSVCLSVSLPLSLSLSLFVFPFGSVGLPLSLSFSVSPSVHPLLGLFLSVHLSACLLVSLSLSLWQVQHQTHFVSLVSGCASDDVRLCLK